LRPAADQSRQRGKTRFASEVGHDDPIAFVADSLHPVGALESEYTKRFRFDCFQNPKLKELRERYHLDAVVAPGQDELDRQVLLLDWVHHQFNLKTAIRFEQEATETWTCVERNLFVGSPFG
jgi:hypothetical protein